MSSMKALRLARAKILYHRPTGVTYAEALSSTEYQVIQAEIDKRVEASKARPFVLPQLWKDTAVSHMLQYVWKHGTVSSTDFSRTHELYRTNGASSRQLYGRHMQFDKFVGHLLERSEPGKGQRFFYKWIGPKTREDWVKKMRPKDVDRWLQMLEAKLVEHGKLDNNKDEFLWLEALRKA